MEETKTCSRCRGAKPLDAFPLSTAKPDGRGAYCRECGRAYAKERRDLDRAAGWPNAAKSRARQMAKWAADPPAPPPAKKCSRCKETKPASEFSRNASSPSGLQSHCKPCGSAAAMEWNKANPGRFKTNARNSRIRQIYGLEPADYLALWESQDGKCRICAQPDPEGKPLPVDHDHATKAVRGLLCRACNTGLGLFGDDVERLRAAITYITGGAA